MAEYLACFETELSSEVFELCVLYSQENYVFKRKIMYTLYVNIS